MLPFFFFKKKKKTLGVDVGVHDAYKCFNDFTSLMNVEMQFFQPKRE